MFTFKRAFLTAAFVLTFFLVLKNTHSSAQSPGPLNSPRPTGSYSDNRKILETLPKPAVVPEEEAVVAPASEEGKAVVADHEPIEHIKPVSYKKQRPQISLEDLRAKPIKEQLAYQFPYDPESKFPAYIWQTWKVTPASGDFNEDFRPYEASWTEKHPTFVHEVITDAVAVHLIRHLYASVPEIVEAYNALPAPVLKADFFRYLILLARGGIYSDIDTAALQSATDWVPAEVPRSSYGLVIGIEADPDRPDWHEWYSRRIQFCQWTIQSKPGHPVLRDIVSRITEETLKQKKAGTLTTAHLSKSVVEFTGPAIWTDSVFHFFNDPEYFDMTTSKGNITWEHFTGITQAKKVGDVVVLPITSFSPGVGQMGAGQDDDPMAFVKHNFEGKSRISDFAPGNLNLVTKVARLDYFVTQDDDEPAITTMNVHPPFLLFWSCGRSSKMLDVRTGSRLSTRAKSVQTKSKLPTTREKSLVLAPPFLLPVARPGEKISHPGYDNRLVER